MDRATSVTQYRVTMHGYLILVVLLSVIDCCAGLEKDVAALLTTARTDETEAYISAALSQGNGTCVGLALANLAAVAEVSRRPRDAEPLAERSIRILEMDDSRNTARLVRPLQILSAASLDNGHVAKSRKAYDRMLQVATDSPEDRFLVHMAGARLLDQQERYTDAEVEILAAIDAVAVSPGAGNADQAALFTSLAMLRISLRRYSEARAPIERAFGILELAKDAGPIDWAEVLHARALLHAKTGQWQQASEDLRDAIARIEGANGTDPAFVRTLLIRYAEALRHIHRRQEAKIIEKRAAGLAATAGRNALVDVSELDPRHKTP